MKYDWSILQLQLCVFASLPCSVAVLGRRRVSCGLSVAQPEDASTKDSVASLPSSFVVLVRWRISCGVSVAQPDYASIRNSSAPVIDLAVASFQLSSLYWLDGGIVEV